MSFSRWRSSGGLLLFPPTFQQFRQSFLKAVLLIAPQGIGAMLTIPIAGTLTDSSRSADCAVVLSSFIT